MRRSRPGPTATLGVTVPLLVVAIVAGLAACEGGADDAARAARRTALEQQRDQLRMQFAGAQNAVRNTQARALDDPSIAPLRERFYDRLRARMIEIEPQAGAWLDRAKELGDRIDELSSPVILQQGQEPPPDDDRDSVMTEFAALEKRMRPIQELAMQDSAVADAFSTMRDSVFALMVRMDPDTEAPIERMRRTAAAVDSIEAELAVLDD